MSRSKVLVHPKALAWARECLARAQREGRGVETDQQRADVLQREILARLRPGRHPPEALGEDWSRRRGRGR